jgi:CheY-like chemotaxis protein
VVHAYDGAEALDQLASHPDTALVLLDLRMPNMNGLAFLRASRRLPAIVKIPIIIVTSESERGDVDNAMSTGAKGYLNKPFRRAELTQVIERVLEDASVVA